MKKHLRFIFASMMVLSLITSDPVSAKNTGLNLKTKSIIKGKSFTLCLKDTKNQGQISPTKKIVKIRKLKKNKWKITGIKAGKTKLKVKIKKKTYICQVSVKSEKTYTSLSCLKEYKQLNIGIQEKDISVKNSFFLYSNKYKKKDIRYISSHPEIAKVDAKGQITPQKAGSTSITAKVGHHQATCTINVHDVAINVSLPATVNEINSYDQSIDSTATISSITFDKLYDPSAKKFLVKMTLSGTSTSSMFCDYQLYDAHHNLIVSDICEISSTGSSFTTSAYINGENGLDADNSYTLVLANHNL